jgi:hypothetical protein
MLQKEIHHLCISRWKDERGHFPICGSHGGIDIGIRTNKLLWRVRPDARRSPDSSGDAQAAKAALIFGHLQDRWALACSGLSGPLAGRVFLKRVLFFLGRLGMTRTRSQLAPTMSIQEAVEGVDRHFMLHLRFKGLVHLLRRGNLSPFGSRENRLVLARSSDSRDGVRLWLTAR